MTTWLHNDMLVNMMVSTIYVLNLVWIRVVFLESDIVVGSPWPCVILKTMWKMARIVHTKCEFCGRLKQSVGSRNSETLETQIFWSLGSSCLAKYIKIHQNTRNGLWLQKKFLAQMVSVITADQWRAETGTVLQSSKAVPRLQAGLPRGDWSQMVSSGDTKASRKVFLGEVLIQILKICLK